jgi:hypothetical protein
MREQQESELLQFLEATGTDQLVLIGEKIPAAAAEKTIRFIFMQNDGRAFHKDFQHILRTDIQRAAELNRKNDPAQGVQLTDYTCRFHGKNLLISTNTDQLL